MHKIWKSLKDNFICIMYNPLKPNLLKTPKLTSIIITPLNHISIYIYIYKMFMFLIEIWNSKFKFKWKKSQRMLSSPSSTISPSTLFYWNRHTLPSTLLLRNRLLSFWFLEIDCFLGIDFGLFGFSINWFVCIVNLLCVISSMSVGLFLPSWTG